MPTAEPAERLIEHDAREPSGQARFALETLNVSEGADITFLHHLLGFGIVPDDAARQAIEALIVAPHQNGERGRLPGTHAG